MLKITTNHKGKSIPQWDITSHLLKCLLLKKKGVILEKFGKRKEKETLVHC